VAVQLGAWYLKAQAFRPRKLRMPNMPVNFVGAIKRLIRMTNTAPILLIGSGRLFFLCSRTKTKNRSATADRFFIVIN